MHIDFKCEKIWLSTEATDLRKAVNGLCAVVVEELKDNPSNGLYIFYNKARNRLKILGWHGNGFILLYKRLEKGRFITNAISSEKLTLTTQQLNWLLAGLDWKLLSNWDESGLKDFF